MGGNAERSVSTLLRWSGWRTELAWAGDGSKDRENRTGFRGIGVEGLGMISKGEGMKRINDTSQFLA